MVILVLAHNELYLSSIIIILKTFFYARTGSAVGGWNQNSTYINLVTLHVYVPSVVNCVEVAPTCRIVNRHDYVVKLTKQSHDKVLYSTSTVEFLKKV